MDINDLLSAFGGSSPSLGPQSLYNPAVLPNGGNALPPAPPAATPKPTNNGVGSQAADSPTAQILATLRPNAVQPANNDPVSTALATLNQAKTNGSGFGAFASGLSAGMGGENARNNSIAQGQQAQQQQTINTLKTLFDMGNTQDSNAETARYHNIMDTYYKGLIAAKNQPDSPPDPKNLDANQFTLAQERIAKMTGYTPGDPNWPNLDPVQQDRNKADYFTQYSDRFGSPPKGPEFKGYDPNAAPAAPATPAAPASQPNILQRIFGGGSQPAQPAANPPASATPPQPPAAQPGAAAPPTPGQPRSLFGADAAAPAPGGGASSPQPMTWKIIRNKKSGEQMLWNPNTGETQPSPSAFGNGKVQPPLYSSDTNTGTSYGLGN